jgi:hypothetical protein
MNFIVLKIFLLALYHSSIFAIEKGDAGYYQAALNQGNMTAPYPVKREALFVEGILQR